MTGRGGRGTLVLMKTLIKNVLIIPMTERDLSLQGDIGIDGTRIAFVGSADKSFVPDTVLDGTGMIAMPSLVNAHTHLSMELMRNYKDTCANLQDWLGEIFPIEDKLTASDIRIVSDLGIAELIKGGTTTFADMYFFAHETGKAVVESGVRACLGLTLFGDVEDSRRRVQERGPLMEAVAAQSNGRIRVDIAPHAIYTCSTATYRYAHDYAKANKTAMHTHLSETDKEVQDSISRFNRTPGDYLASIGCFDDIRTYLAHCVHSTDAELSRFTAYDIGIVHNPTSNCKLASGIAPIAKIRQAGIPLALGTDGASSNNNLNLIEEMHIASLLCTVSTGNTMALTPYDTVRMATAGGAEVLGLDDRIGTLEAGKDADLILVDTKKSHMTPLNNPFSALVFSAQASDVDTVFCQGRLLMQNRRLTTIEETEAMRKTELCWKDILTRA